MSDRLNILNWAKEDRPREKLLLKGKQSLSEAELIAILIGSGSAELSAVDLAKLILSSLNNDLNALAQCTVNDLTKFKGIGEAKAISIVSALELGRRRKESGTVTKPKLTSSRDAYELIKPFLLDQPFEAFWIILLDRSNKLIRPCQISQGGVSGTVADPKIIFKQALEHLASGVILVHNHPSGNLKPSVADENLTKKMVAAGKLLEISVIDHLIFTNESYFSFADEGLI